MVVTRRTILRDHPEVSPLQVNDCSEQLGWICADADGNVVVYRRLILHHNGEQRLEHEIALGNTHEVRHSLNW